MNQVTDNISPEFAAHIHREKIHLLRAQLPFMLIAVIFVATGIAIIFWDVVDACG